MIVVDVNILAYCWIPGPRTAEARRVLHKDPHWRLPMLWRSEMLNILVGYLRREQLSFDQALLAIRTLERRYRDNEHRPRSETVLKRARSSGCPAYDCEYAALAYELNIPLITEDQALLQAFPDIALDMNAFAAS